MEHKILDVGTGEVTVIPFTSEETAAQEAAAQVEAARQRIAILAEFRLLREQVLNRLSGVYIDLAAANDTAGMAAVIAARQGLRDLPQHQSVVAAADAAALKQAVTSRYKAISAALAAASPQAFSAFRGLDA